MRTPGYISISVCLILISFHLRLPAKTSPYLAFITITIQPITMTTAHTTVSLSAISTIPVNMSSKPKPKPNGEDAIRSAASGVGAVFF